jgi:hypothetical protein
LGAAEAAHAIADDIDEKVDKRLKDFRDFKAVIESAVDPAAALRARFAS